jgi:hypothetical protein
MLWLIVILLIGALSFVIFHKPHVNSMGAGWVPPEQRKPLPVERQLAAPALPAADVTGSSEDAVTGRVTKVEPQMPDTFNFNDVFGGPKNQGPTDRPNA